MTDCESAKTLCENYKKTHLIRMCIERGLPTYGRKADLAARLTTPYRPRTTERRSRNIIYVEL